uniref:Uncharacterized protein n=1 Tax=Anguilla anguilla TaxID=7936 RepID=A0A0E9R6C9_ANGAN
MQSNQDLLSLMKLKRRAQS